MSGVRKFFDHVRSVGHTTYRKVGKALNISKSAAWRRGKKIEKRSHCLSSKHHETEEGQEFLKKLVITIITIFNICCGVGAEKISQFFKYMEIDKFVGTSASSILKIANIRHLSN